MPHAIIKGYASRFDEIDRAGDVVKPGAFVCAQRVGLWNSHKPLCCGKWQVIKQDHIGLYVEGIVINDYTVRQIQDGVNGLSIGYFTHRARYVKGLRELLCVELTEISVVEDPVLTSARLEVVEYVY